MMFLWQLLNLECWLDAIGEIASKDAPRPPASRCRRGRRW
jgi:hypothetical protein